MFFSDKMEFIDSSNRKENNAKSRIRCESNIRNCIRGLQILNKPDRIKTANDVAFSQNFMDMRPPTSCFDHCAGSVKKGKVIQ